MLSFLKKLINPYSGKKIDPGLKGNVDLLIAGLGNPGSKYRNSRHNIGWMVAERLAGKYRLNFDQDPIFYHTAMNLNGKKAVIILPTTYMNNSGEAVRKALNLLDLQAEDSLIIVDEYNFPLGKIHLKEKGSSGGHNGVESVISELDTEEFMRLRCGIDKNFPPGGMVNYVLANFAPYEIDDRDKMIDKSVEAIEYILKNGKKHAMPEINSGAL